MKKLFVFTIISLVFLTGCSRNMKTDAPLEEMTEVAMSQYDGKNGEKCYVAVSGNVYSISNSSSWINGKHLDSEGKASCGDDLTDVMSDSPHGISILTTSPKVKLVGKIIS
jgi:predicted heme/steroid binding protein